jgi:hypothetical protein
VQTSLGWQLVSERFPTHILRSEEDAVAYARSLGVETWCIVTMYDAHTKPVRTRGLAA